MSGATAVATAVTLNSALQGHEIVENFLRSLVASGVDPSALLVGVHNVFCHGWPFEEQGLAIEEADIGIILEGLDAAIKQAQAVENR
jgi:hypothetical protein